MGLRTKPNEWVKSLNHTSPRLAKTTARKLPPVQPPSSSSCNLGETSDRFASICLLLGAPHLNRWAGWKRNSLVGDKTENRRKTPRGGRLSRLCPQQIWIVGATPPQIRCPPLQLHQKFWPNPNLDLDKSYKKERKAIKKREALSNAESNFRTPKKQISFDDEFF